MPIKNCYDCYRDSCVGCIMYWWKINGVSITDEDIASLQMLTNISTVECREYLEKSYGHIEKARDLFLGKKIYKIHTIEDVAERVKTIKIWSNNTDVLNIPLNILNPDIIEKLTEIYNATLSETSLLIYPQ